MSIYESGKRIVSLFYALIKAVQVYDLNNDVVQNSAKRLIDYINTLLTLHSHIELVRYRDYVFFNKQRLRFEIDGYASLQFVHDKLKILNIRSLTIIPGIEKNEIILFASIFKENQELFSRQFSSKRFQHISVDFSTGEDEIPDFLKNGEKLKRTYFKALKVTRNLMHNLWTNQPVDVRHSRRIVYGLIDSLSRDEFGLIALTAIKNFDEYTYNHSLNVGILSLALGQRLGIKKKDLADLGTAGLLHDIGKVEIPKELIYKSGRLTDREWNILKLHSDFGVKQILKTRGLDDTGLVSMTVSYQHHWNFDGTGYPEHDPANKPVLFSRIVRICDSYDAMTTPRIYQPVPYLPPIAVRVIWKLRQKCFDPTLVKIFVQLLGVYPVGSCLKLSSGETGLVIRQNQGSPELPILKIIIDKDQKKIDGRIVDLTVEKELKIITPIYAQKYGINPSEYFV
ncbi:MAG TPA: HD domain-containing protein [candidate division WOR-3 bacterium]|uniref:HD domain-containing protein n=1 Tax=candidate division WOR-3 bacterium TaxID=2052148 RepID=A0A9C9EKI8_UNCW3|nr:HD domain-containing protein [candidate division WOR-3 bacterium]